MVRNIFCFLILGTGFVIVYAKVKEPFLLHDWKIPSKIHWESYDDATELSNPEPQMRYNTRTQELEFSDSITSDESCCCCSTDDEVYSEFIDPMMWGESCCCCTIDDEEHNSTYAPFTPFTPSLDPPTSTATSNDKILPYCQQDSGNDNLNICEKELEQENSTYCYEMRSTFKVLESLCRNDTYTESTLKDLRNSVENISRSASLLDIERKEHILTTLPLLMDGISAVALSLTFENRQPLEVEENSIVEIAVAFISYGKLESLLGQTVQKNGTFLGNETLNYTMNSRLANIVTSKDIIDISTPVDLTFRHLKDKAAKEEVLCVHWNSGVFSTHGCEMISSSTTHTECRCQHLSSFAVLTATTPTEGDQILTIIGQIGLSISVICLFLCIVTFIFCRASHNSTTFIHLQLSFCLFFADLLFLIGIDKTGIKILCSVIAGMLKYLFLACFVWMFLEAVSLYFIARNLKVANYSGVSKYMKISMYLIGYGVPVLIVAISAAIKPESFGTSRWCWLHSSFIWSFMGPVCVIVVVNLVIFCLILKTLHEKLASLNSGISTAINTRSLMFKAMAHVFILGVTWCFGFFQYGNLTKIMAYMFTIFNSIQGIFIFLVHCLLNQKVREAYRHWLYCKKDIKPPVSEITMSSVPISPPVTNASCINEVHNQKIEWQEKP
ncbi:adhesion G protein-coupled receptor E3-like isoform X2 [Erythrolamprus reginae]|uniref:adhesion G protein-coupled receptor E3-like isoform X2 n=1 Tax=Erythrolamprus reginae TaxID=121349 RepID=UPI00396C8DBC